MATRRRIAGGETRRGSRTAFAAVVALAVTMALPAQGGPSAPAAPSVTAPFPAILWVQRATARDDSFWERVATLGYAGVNVTTGESPSAARRAGLGFYGSQLVAKGSLELTDAQWRPCLDGFLADRDERWLRRPTELDDPAVRASLEHALDAELTRLVAAGPWAFALGDEISFTRHGNPFDFGFSTSALRGLRRALAGDYGDDLDRLNRAWGTGFWSWDVVRPPTTDAARRAALQGDELPRDLRAWNDRLNHVDRSFAALVGGLVERVAAVAPTVPVGLTGIQAPAAFGGHDYRRLLPRLSFWEVYDQGGAFELARSFGRADARVVTTVFPPPASLPVESAVVHTVHGALAHGLDGLVVWSADDVLAAGGREAAEQRATPFGRAVSRTLAELGPARAAFSGARPRYAPIWIVESQPSVRAHWMFDSRLDGATWPKRFTSYEREHSTSQSARQSWLRLLEDLGYQPRFVSAADLARSLPAARPRVVILPACLALSDAACGALYDFTDRGGTVVADHGCALYDERLARRDGAGGLDELFGVQRRSFAWRDRLVREGQPVAEAVRLPSGAAPAERGTRAAIAQPVAGGAELWVQLENGFGRGRAYYLNLAVCEYAAARTDPARVALARDLRSRVRAIVAPRVPLRVDVRGKGLPTIVERIRLVARDGRDLLAVRVNVGADERAIVDAIAAHRATIEATTIELAFPRAIRLVDLVTGEDLGVADRFERPFDPWRTLFFALEPAR